MKARKKLTEEEIATQMEHELQASFRSCKSCGGDLGGKSLKCTHCGGPVIETDLLYLNELERYVLKLFDAACEAKVPFELSAAKEGRDPFLLALENLLRHVKVYHYEGDGCREMLKEKDDKS